MLDLQIYILFGKVFFIFFGELVLIRKNCSFALEKDVKQSSALAVPQLYADCQSSTVLFVLSIVIGFVLIFEMVFVVLQCSNVSVVGVARSVTRLYDILRCGVSTRVVAIA
jgi:hypothetical protein